MEPSSASYSVVLYLEKASAIAILATALMHLARLVHAIPVGAIPRVRFLAYAKTAHAEP